MTLIGTDNDFALMAALFVIAGCAFLAEKTRFGAHLTGAVIAILAAIAAANLRIIPHAAPAYDFVFGYFVRIENSGVEEVQLLRGVLLRFLHSTPPGQGNEPIGLRDLLQLNPSGDTYG